MFFVEEHLVYYFLVSADFLCSLQSLSSPSQELQFADDLPPPTCMEAVLSTPLTRLPPPPPSIPTQEASVNAVKPISSDNFILVSTLANSLWEAKNTDDDTYDGWGLLPHYRAG